MRADCLRAKPGVALFHSAAAAQTRNDSIPTEPCVNDRRVLENGCDVRGYGDRDHRMYDQRTCALFAGGR